VAGNLAADAAAVVNTATVRRGTIAATVDANGRLEALTTTDAAFRAVAASPPSTSR